MKIDLMRSGSMKGQAMMEYLMTYGLALFVILIVLAILVAVVLPSLKAPDTCQFTQPGFTCNQKAHSIVAADVSNDVRLIFQLDNAQGKSIEVKGVLCTSAPTGNVDKDDVTPFTAVKQMSAGQSIVFGSTGDEVPCYTEGTTTVVKLAPNSNFKGSLAVVYRFEDDLGPDRLAVATVTGAVQAE
ncbi:MAG: hypothetical protein V1827_01415 [Candidatus Micrarchaeota archaeon]